MTDKNGISKKKIIDLIKYELVKTDVAVGEFRKLEENGIDTGNTLYRYAGRKEILAELLMKINK